jgi:hypothetical protein
MLLIQGLAKADVVIGAGWHEDAGASRDRLLGGPIEVGRFLRLVLK